MPRYFRFPLALLAYNPSDPLATITTIFQWCPVDAGNAMYAENDEAELIDMAKDADLEEYRKVEPDGADELRAFMGAKLVGLANFRCDQLIRGYRDAEKFLRLCSSESVKNRVNMSSDWLWSCVYTLRGTDTERTLSWREFCILSALLSKIGSAKYAKCGWQEIQARAAGICGKSGMKLVTVSEQKRREPLMLSRDKIRATLDRLEADAFFARFQYNRAESWFSFSCPEGREKLIEWVSGKKVRRAETLKRKRATDEASGAAITARKGLASPYQAPHGNAPSNAPKTPTINRRAKEASKSPPLIAGPDNQAPADEQSPPHPHLIPTINENDEKIPTINESEEMSKTAPPVPHLTPQVTPTLCPTSPPPLTKNNLNKNNSNGNNSNKRTTVNTPPPAPPVVEHGYLIEGQFLTSHEMNEMIKENRDRFDEIRKIAKQTKRIDGVVQEPTP